MFPESHHIYHWTDIYKHMQALWLWRMLILFPLHRWRHRLVVFRVTQFCSCGAESQVQILSTNSLPFTVNQTPTSGGDKNVLDVKTYLTILCSWAQFQRVYIGGEVGLPHTLLSSFWDTSRVFKISSQFWHFQPGDNVIFHFSWYLGFWPTGCKSEVP